MYELFQASVAGVPDVRHPQCHSQGRPEGVSIHRAAGSQKINEFEQQQEKQPLAT